MQNGLTEKQYALLCKDRAELVKRLLKKSLRVPEGYAVTDDPLMMYGNSILAIRPRHPVPGSRMINFIHRITYRSRLIKGEFRRTPVEESIRAVGDMYSRVQKDSVVWESDPGFGTDGRIVSIIRRGYTDKGLAVAVREIVSKISSP